MWIQFKILKTKEALCIFITANDNFFVLYFKVTRCDTNYEVLYMNHHYKNIQQTKE